MMSSSPIETLTFTVAGVAQTKGSTRAFIPKGWTRPIITNDNPKAKDWQQLIARAAGDALVNAKLQPFQDAPVLLDVWFYFPRPQKFLTKKYAAVDVPHTTRPDADKCLRLVKDSLSKVIWRDDAQVVDAYAHKRYCADGESPRAVITVRPLRHVLPRPKPQPSEPLLFDQEVSLYGTQA